MGKKPEDNPLNPKQELFVEHYLKCLNAGQAYREVYPDASEATAETNGPRLLRNAHIKAAIEAGRARLKSKLGLDQEWVLQRLKAVADGHIGKVATFKGQSLTLRDSSELTDDDLRSLTSIKTKSSSTPMGDSFEFAVTVKDNVKALELIGKHIGMWRDKGPEDDDNTTKQAVDTRIDELFTKFKG
jgi:phage terminase small subunit